MLGQLLDYNDISSKDTISTPQMCIFCVRFDPPRGGYIEMSTK